MNLTLFCFFFCSLISLVVWARLDSSLLSDFQLKIFIENFGYEMWIPYREYNGMCPVTRCSTNRSAVRELAQAQLLRHSLLRNKSDCYSKLSIVNVKATIECGMPRYDTIVIWLNRWVGSGWNECECLTIDCAVDDENGYYYFALTTRTTDDDEEVDDIVVIETQCWLANSSDSHSHLSLQSQSSTRIGYNSFITNISTFK